MNRAVDVLVVGAGPAGLSAAHAAACSGARVGVIDDNPHAGGQIWRGGPEAHTDARSLWAALRSMDNVTMFQQCRVVMPLDERMLLAESGGQPLHFRYGSLILATGARERLLPFPGWTLPGVTGAGGLQALAKGGYPVGEKRVVVAGSGPLLLAVAATLLEKGARVQAIVEQAPQYKLAQFALSLFATPAKLRQAIQLKARLRNIAYWTNSYPVEACGNARLESVRVRRGNDLVDIPCDALACGFGLLPNTELASAFGCALDQGAVAVDAHQSTSAPHVFSAGESTGVGGVGLARIEGRIAGLAATGKLAEAEKLFGERARWQAFARRLAHAFALRPELRSLCKPDTLVCRCEDVPHAELAMQTSWRSAKLHTRCGMGPCQGRVCGGATGFLYGWTPDSSRTPAVPARISSLISAGDSGQSVVARR
ncbi:NAD(P)/FAD-dependent oxidoreductase [Noviherbaspirillum denitrificans]|uniref:FAD/NAD(P)-binding oxidoreductase n=1 Tax=Noviherbaspirillum denitrificans TaxID=1968433 RepID=A0A254TFG8_9BURK|nr:FAD/NAD(P)-binding oxidoreductase [Noviherbaspirillum denitrificans]